MKPLMICPKIGNPKDECISSGGCSPCIHKTPHNKMPSCIDEGKVCHHCIPYIREFKIGDNVRVPSGKEVYNICDTTFRDSFIRFILKEHPIIDFRANELELIIGGGKIMNENKLKYKAGGKKLTLRMVVDSASSSESENFIRHYLKWSSSVCVKHSDLAIKINDRLIEYAQQHDCFIKYLLENNNVKETKSNYDEWVDECPVMASKLEVLEWAKRMPR